MKKLLTQAAILCLVALSFNPARAAFDPTTVPADAKWVVYVDFNTLRESPVGKELVALVEKNAAMPNDSGLQVDIPKVIATLGSATAYGTTFSKDPKEIDGTLILQGTDDLRKIAEGLAVQFSISNPEIVTEVKGLPFSAYSIKGEVTVAFPAEPIILISRSRPQLLKALELFRGKGASLARGQSSLKNLIPKAKSLFVLAASDVPNTDGLFPEDAPQTRILKMASSASVAIGNDDKLTTACIQLVATDDDTSDKLLKIVQGMTAMLSLAQSDDKQIAEFLRSVKAERSGRIISVNLAYASEGLVKMIHAIEQDGHHASTNHVQPSRKKPGIQGKVVGTWTVSDEDEQTSEPQEALAYHTIENVALKNGTTIILTGHREDDARARLDAIDITPSAGGQPLHFEAENLKLSRYHVAKSSKASGGKLIVLENGSTGTARCEFPGVDGSYTLKVRYGNETEGTTVFTVSVQDPEPTSTDEPSVPEPPAAPEAPVAPEAK
jgi:hypothetical protein